MHTTTRVEHQSLTRINQGVQSDCDRLRANCNELEATCSVLENLRDRLAQVRSSLCLMYFLLLTLGVFQESEIKQGVSTMIR